jgi:hypothetical protein
MTGSTGRAKMPASGIFSSIFKMSLHFFSLIGVPARCTIAGLVSGVAGRDTTRLAGIGSFSLPFREMVIAGGFGAGDAETTSAGFGFASPITSLGLGLGVSGGGTEVDERSFFTITSGTSSSPVSAFPRLRLPKVSLTDELGRMVFSGFSGFSVFAFSIAITS